MGSGAGVGVGSTTPGTGQGTTAAYGGTGANTDKLGTKAIIFISNPKRRQQKPDSEAGEKITNVYETVPTEPAPIHLPQKKYGFSIFNKKRPSPHNWLEWIPYEELEEVEFVAKGGFGIVEKAIWREGKVEKWEKRGLWNVVESKTPMGGSRQKRIYKSDITEKPSRKGPMMVAVKTFDKMTRFNLEFLREIESHLRLSTYSSRILHVLGITLSPSNHFSIILDYAPHGNLRDYLRRGYLTWHKRVRILHRIAAGLHEIHTANLIHKDLHSGNILVGEEGNVVIADLGLCDKVVDSEYEKIRHGMAKEGKNVDRHKEAGGHKIFGVLPYVAPEVLRGHKYEQYSDIYSFGILTWEVSTQQRPYYNRTHDHMLAVDICYGMRPDIPSYVPKSVRMIINRCWDTDVEKRPTAGDIRWLLWQLSKTNNGESEGKESFEDEKGKMAVWNIGDEEWRSISNEFDFDDERTVVDESEYERLDDIEDDVKTVYTSKQIIAVRDLGDYENYYKTLEISEDQRLDSRQMDLSISTAVDEIDTGNQED
ncbi:7419_t:CDS:2 [Paraglomus occultum]|uniref:7419_t:CDS:1 n=1 Tax=Paraglomus occultum TaxID=144539 RepID=A0A9N8WE76_9GLOM|nr:7419_t:CDS:2 [Paraglomus occultum]